MLKGLNASSNIMKNQNAFFKFLFGILITLSVGSELAFAENFLQIGIRCSNPREGIDFLLQIKKASEVYAPNSNNAVFSDQLKDQVENPGNRAKYFSLGNIAERVSDVRDLSLSIPSGSQKGSAGVFDDYNLTWTSVKRTAQKQGRSVVETNVSTPESAQLHLEFNKAISISSSEAKQLENTITYEGREYPLDCEFMSPGYVNPATGEHEIR